MAKWIVTYFLNDSNVPLTGLTPTIRIRNLSDNSLVITDASMTEVGDGTYKYSFASYDPDIDYSIRCDAGTAIIGRYNFSSTSQDLEAEIDSMSGTLGTVNSTVTTINTNTDTLETTLGTVNTNVNTINSTTGTINTNVNTSNTNINLIKVQTDTIPNVAGNVWDVVQASHITVGTTGRYLYNTSSGGIDPATIATAVWDALKSGYTVTGSFGKALNDLNLSRYTGYEG